VRGAEREARNAKRETRGARREARGARREARGARREARRNMQVAIGLCFISESQFKTWSEVFKEIQRADSKAFDKDATCYADWSFENE